MTIMARCLHRQARPSKVRGTRWWWCPDCRTMIRPPSDEPASEYERVAKHVMVDIQGRQY